MNTRFYNAKILTLADHHKFEITEGELWVKGNTICYIGDGRTRRMCARMEKCWCGIARSMRAAIC